MRKMTRAKASSESNILGIFGVINNAYIQKCSQISIFHFFF